MDFNFETKDSAIEAFIKDIECKGVEVKNRNEYDLDLRHYLDFSFDGYDQYEKAYDKLIAKKAVVLFGKKSGNDISLSVLFYPKPKNRFDIVVFDSDTKKQIALISRETKDDALIEFFSRAGFETTISGAKIVSKKNRSIVKGASWGDIFNKRAYGILESFDGISGYSKLMRLEVVFNYRMQTRITMLNGVDINLFE